MALGVEQMDVALEWRAPRDRDPLTMAPWLGCVVSTFDYGVTQHSCEHGRHLKIGSEFQSPRLTLTHRDKLQSFDEPLEMSGEVGG